MSTQDVEQLKADIQMLRNNPAGIQRRAFEMLDRPVVDPSNPFSFLLGVSAVATSAAIEENSNNTRKQYESLATNFEELYLHMSDKDYIGRFATPSRTSFELFIAKDEILAKAVPTGDAAGTRKLIIPRNTEFTVSGYTFTLEYPVEIRTLPHGGVQVVYDVTQPSPLVTKRSNIVDWRFVQGAGVTFVYITLPVSQFKVTSYKAHLTQSQQFTQSYELEDQFYYCRVYRQRKDNSGWVEIKTTHTDQVFDPRTPTAVLQVTEDRLQVTIPQIYINTGQLDGTLRIDIYTTRGALDLVLSSYEPNAFNVKWRDLGQKLTRFTTPLEDISQMSVMSTSVVTGGTDGLTFDQLRERVLTNALGASQTPITNAQLNAQLANAGYQPILDVDNVTNRIFLAGRSLPPPSSGETLSGAANMMAFIQNTFEELQQFEGVVDNVTQLTLTSEVLYHQVDDKVTLLPNSEREALLNATEAAQINRLNAERILCSPFHYVLDIQSDYFDIRTYYLNNPSIVSRQFVEENGGVAFNITTGQIAIRKEPDGYRLRLITQSNNVATDLADGDVGVQMSYRPRTENRDVFMNGRLFNRLDNGEWRFEFMITSDFAVDALDSIFFNSFTLYPNETTGFVADLVQTFDLVYYVLNQDANDPDQSLDFRGKGELLGDNAIGVAHEKIEVQFGQPLDDLWHRSRSFIGPQAYRQYEQDVIAYYDETVYERDSNGNRTISVDDENNVTFNVLHRPGDMQRHANGEPIIKHHRGEYVRDDQGEPVIVGDRSIVREFSVFVHDAKYRFASRAVDQDYLLEIPETIVSWVNEDMARFKQWVLEKTEIYLYPLRTMGRVEATIDDGSIEQLELEQSLEIRFYLNRDQYDNYYLRDELDQLTKGVIQREFARNQISISTIVDEIKEQAGSDILAVNASGLGGQGNFQVVTLNDPSQRLTIGKKMSRDLDGDLRIDDAIDVVFIRHDI